MAEFLNYVEGILVFFLVVSLSLFGWSLLPSDVVIENPIVSVDIDSAVVQMEPNVAADVPTADSQPEAAVDPIVPQNEPEPIYHNHRSSSSRRSSNPSTPVAKAFSALRNKVADEGRTRVIVNLNNAGKAGEVLSQLDSFEKAVDMKNGFAGYVDAADLAALENSPAVDFIYEDMPLTIASAQSFPLINADKAASVTYNGFADLTGAGQTVCVIDSGVDYAHDDLGNCSAVGGSCSKIIGGYDFYNSDNDPADDLGHGTAVAGIIAGNGSGYQGIAPESKIIALKVTDSAGNGWGSLLANAVDWCVNNASTFNITIISLGVSSPGTLDNPSTCDLSSYASNINNAVSNNIIVFAPTGNSEDTTGISNPACLTNVVSVSAVADGSGGGSAADLIPNASADLWGPNRYPGMTDLMAPGSFIDVLALESGSSYASDDYGTSFASAHAVGSAILLRELYEERYTVDLTPAEIKNILKITGKDVWDSATSANYSRIDILKAVNYEEYDPVIVLEATNDSTVGPGVILLEYNVNDAHNVVCSLYVDGALNQTDSTVTRGVTQSFAVDLAEAVYTWRVECTDNATVPNTAVSETYTLNVVNANLPPVLTGILDQNVGEDGNPADNWVDLYTYATDPDNADNELTFAIVTESDSALIDCSIVSNRYVDCANPAAEDNGFSDINVSVTDGESFDYDVFRVTVNAIDDPAEWNTLSNQNVDEDSADGTVVYSNIYAECSDIDNTVNIDGVTSTHSNYDLVMVASDLTIENMASNYNGGPETVNISCNGVITSFDLTVNAVNDVPTLSGLPNQNLDENSGMNSDLFNLETYASDVETAVSSLTYTITGETNTAVVDCLVDGSNFIDCDVQAGQSGSSDVIVQVDDGENTSTDVFTVTVAFVNDPPVLSGVPDRSVGEDGNPVDNWIDLWSYVSDSDNATAELTFAIVTESDSALVDCSVASNRFIDCANPAAEDNGFSDINVSVFDGTSYDYDVCRVTVTAEDDPASWNSLSNKNVDEDSTDNTVVYSNIVGECTDIDDAEVVTVTSSHANYDLAVSGNDLVISNMIINYFGGPETVDLDCNGVSASFDLTINSVNDIPSISGIANQDLDEDSGMNQDLVDLESHVDDVETLPSAMVYTIISETNTAVVDCVIDGSNFIDCDVQAGQSGSSDVTVEVSDGTDTNTDVFTVTVIAANVPPTLSGIPDQNTDEDVAPVWTVHLEPYAIDPDGNVSEGVFSREAQSNGSLIDCIILHNSTGDYLACLQPDANQSGYSDVTIKFTDERGDSANDIVRVTVNPVNDDPVLDAISNIVVSEGDLVQITPSATEVDGDSVSYSYESPLDASGEWQTSLGDAGNYDVNVSVTDGFGGYDWQMVNIQVNAVPLVADLRIKSSEVYTSSPTAGTWTVFKIVIENIGNVAANNVYWLFDTDSVEPNQSYGPFDIQPNKTRNVYPEVTYNVSGTYNPVFTVDVNDTVSESDENNNNVTIAVTIA